MKEFDYTKWGMKPLKKLRSLYRRGQVNELLKKFISSAKDYWKKRKPIQKVMLISIVIVAVIAIVAATRLSTKIEAIEDVQIVDVNIVVPENQPFDPDQTPVTACVIIKVNPTSSPLQVRKRILGIQRLILSTVEGLKEENIIIIDTDGNQINDFEGFVDSDSIEIIAI